MLREVLESFGVGLYVVSYRSKKEFCIFPCSWNLLITLSELPWHQQTQDGCELGMALAVLTFEDEHSALEDRAFSFLHFKLG